MSDELGTHSTHSLVLHSLNLLYCTNPSLQGLCLFGTVGNAGLSCNAFALGVSHIMEVRMLLSRDMISCIFSGQ